MLPKDRRYARGLGQRSEFSFYDVMALNAAYCPHVCENSRHTCRNGGFLGEEINLFCARSKSMHVVWSEIELLKLIANRNAKLSAALTVEYFCMTMVHAKSISNQSNQIKLCSIDIKHRIIELQIPKTVAYASVRMASEVLTAVTSLDLALVRHIVAD